MQVNDLRSNVDNNRITVVVVDNYSVLRRYFGNLLRNRSKNPPIGDCYINFQVFFKHFIQKILTK